MPAPVPVSPFGLRLRQLAEAVDYEQARGLSVRDAVLRVDEYERAEIAQTLGFDDACSAVAMRQLASSVSALAAAQAAADSRLAPVLARAVDALEREAVAREALAVSAPKPPAAAGSKDVLSTVRRLGEKALSSAWFGAVATLCVGALLRACEAMP